MTYPDSRILGVVRNSLGSGTYTSFVAPATVPAGTTHTLVFATSDNSMSNPSRSDGIPVVSAGSLIAAHPRGPVPLPSGKLILIANISPGSSRYGAGALDCTGPGIAGKTFVVSGSLWWGQATFVYLSLPANPVMGPSIPTFAGYTNGFSYSTDAISDTAMLFTCISLRGNTYGGLTSFGDGETVLTNGTENVVLAHDMAGQSYTVACSRPSGNDTMSAFSVQLDSGLLSLSGAWTLI